MLIPIGKRAGLAAVSFIKSIAFDWSDATAAALAAPRCGRRQLPRRRRIVKRGAIAALTLLMLAPVRGWAQTGAAIAGSVRDETGASVPGVTVEASSPALIEKVRSVVTDDAGLYRIVDLRPGIYSVTFTLPGFSTVKREEIELTTGFTANVSVTMKVGEVSETIVVSGLTPVVDIQTATQQLVLTRDVMDTLPNGRQYFTIGEVTPGIITRSNSGQAAGGSMGRDAQMLLVHGSGLQDFALLLDGFPQMIFYTGIPGVQGVMPPDGLNEEINLLSGGNPPEADSGGVRINMVPKSGGNAFRGDLFANFAHNRLSWDNLTPALAQQLGLTENKAINHLTDVNPTAGGPIRRDRLWFFASFRDTQASTRTIWLPDLNPHDWAYTADTSRTPAADERPVRNFNGRLTWAMSPRNKLNFSLDVSKGLHGAGNLGLQQVAPEAWVAFHYRKKPGTQITWNAPLTSRLLLEAGAEFDRNTVTNIPAFDTTVTPGATEQSNNQRFRAQLGGFSTTDYLHHRANYRFLRGSAAYVTGSHAFKVGLQMMPASASTTYDLVNGGPPYYVTLLNGAPRSVTYLATPRTQEVSNLILGLYAQDQWTVRRLTVNAGLRFDSMNAGYPSARHAATPTLPSIDVSGETVLKWRDVSPRFGFAYDLLGNGKTAVKATVNRYITPEIAHGRVLTQALQAGGGFTSVRTWNDATSCAGCISNDFVPQGDPLNASANGELGPSPNRFFGQAFVTNRFDPEWAHGWGTRQFNWEFSTSLQHQLADGVGVNVGYFRRVFGNFAVTDNLAVAPGDYDQYLRDDARRRAAPGWRRAAVV